MDESAARAWLEANYDVSRETIGQLSKLVDTVVSENERQNLISRATISEVWARHIIDSAQLLRFAPASTSPWIDLGTGAGFPGLVVAILHGGPVTLVEERKLRADFLVRAAAELGLSEKVTVLSSKLERLTPTPFAVISARAFAPLEKLLTISHAFSTEKTRWILPKGRNAASELEAAASSWQGDFRLEPSVTDPDASIIVADAVQPKVKRRGGR